MFLKSIEIQGFKSFADKTVLKFGKGVTAVVGPNGSGKSNISDAVRWVLGEQSTKNLRGQSMEDVIFSGTANRRPHGFAEVTLTIDNSDRTLNFDNDEVSITRRYFRSHESEYLINKAVVRLRDVNELFMDTGLGRDGYSMIGQGKIDNIVSSKSDERRDIFEEASGISRYRYRKIESEKKLSLADDNYLRLMDIFTELEGRVGPLAEQSEKAKKFLELSADKKDLEIGLWLNNLNQSNDLLKNQDNKITVAKAQYKDIEDSLLDIANSIELKSEEQSSAIVRIDEIRREISEIDETIARTEGEIALQNSSIEFNLKSIERLKSNLDDIANSDSRTLIEIENRKRDIEEKQKLIDEFTIKSQEINEKLTGLISNSENISRQIEDLTMQLNKLSVDISEHKVAKVTAESSVAEINARNIAVKELLEENQSKLTNLENELGELYQFSKSTEEKIEECTNSLKGYQIRFDSRAQKLADYKEKLDTARLDLEDKKRRVHILHELEKNMEGYNYSVKKIMQEATNGILSGIHGPISKIITVPTEYAVAIEIALGSSLQNIVVNNENDAKRAINYLKTKNSGRATFLPISTIKPKNLTENGLDDCFGFVGIASELITTDKKYADIISSLLGKTVIVEDLDSAVTISKKYSNRFKIVTLDGQIVNAGGSLTGGSLSKNVGIISRSGEIEKLNAEIGKLGKKIIDLTEQYNLYQSEVSSVEADIINAKSELTAAQEDKIRVDGEIRRVSDIIASFNTSSTALNEELLANDVRTGELLKTIADSDAAILQLTEQYNVTQNEITEKSGGRDTVTDERNELSEKLTEIKITILEYQKDVESLNSSVKLLEDNVSNSDSKCEDINREITELLQKNQNAEEHIAELEKLIVELKDKATAKNEEINLTNESRNNIDKESQQLRVTEREKTAEKEKLGGEVARLEERKENMLKEYDEIIKKLFDEYELTRTEAELLTKPVENIAEAKKQLGEIKSKIKSLGNVNVAAIEEYKEVSERYEYLSAQLEDVEKSRKELSKLIEEITAQMKEKFIIGFEKINENFKTTFAQMFNGGHAELVLTEPENILESGINIVAKLPGKNVPSLDGLSGGEKALIAISIYFAIMKVNPPPFCFLDEVDTALDDINVDRFAEYMKKSQFNTQFICVTHRRGTMDSADMLYGVTMQEKGITKLLQLDVEELVRRLNIEAQ